MKRALRTLRKSKIVKKRPSSSTYGQTIRTITLLKPKEEIVPIIYKKLSNSNNIKVFNEALPFFRPYRQGDNENYLISPEKIASYFSNLFDTKNSRSNTHVPWTIATAEQNPMNKDF